MLLKALIADDEKYVCELLKHLIDWNSMEIELVGAAHDGHAAMQMIRDLKPDIAVIDIRMPGLDGLEVIRQTREEEIPVSFLLISGHKNFEYAHTAIKYRVENYLLKPVSKKELEDNIRQMRAGILEQRNATELQSYNRERLKKLYASRLCRHPQKVRGKTIAELNEAYQLNFQPGYFCVVAVRPDGKKDLDQTQNAIILNQTMQFFSRYLEDCYEKIILATGYDVLIVLNYPDSNAILQSLQDIFEKMRVNYQEYCSFTLGISHEATDPHLLEADEAYQGIRERILSGCDRIYCAAQMTKKPPVGLADKGDWRLLEQALELASAEKTGEWFSVFFHLIQHADLPADELIDTAGRVRDLLILKFPEQEKHHRIGRLAEHAVRTATSKKMLCDQLERICLETIQREISMRDIESSKYIRMAKQYIREHYDEGITLSDLAGQVYMTPNYFSALFKKQEGITFSDYLTRVRIEKARELLTDLSLSITEVAHRCGYSEAKYFSRIFAREVGLKPSEYRRFYI